MMRRFTEAALGAAVVLALGAAAGVVAGSSAAEGARSSSFATTAAQPVVATLSDTAVFNDPFTDTGTASDPSNPRYRIENTIIGLVNGAPSGSTIRINFLYFQSTGLRDALITAHRTRHVNVQAIIDGNYAYNSTHATFKAVWDDLNGARAFTGDTSTFVQCGNGTSTGCNGSGIHHSKFALFSSTEGADNVVFETSENENNHTDAPNSGVMAFNNAVIITDQDALYQGYLARFKANLAQHKVAYASAPDTFTKGYFFPQDADQATLLGILGNVDCTAKNTTGGWGPNHYTSIHVVQSQWDDEDIARKLLQMDTDGCVVHVIRNRDTNPPDERYTSVDHILLTCEKRNGITQDLVAGQPGQDYIHSKYLVIDGNYYGKANQREVWTGSYNYTDGARRTNDETLLAVRDDSIVDAFQSNFYALAALPTTLNGQTYRQTIQPGVPGSTCTAPGHS